MRTVSASRLCCRSRQAIRCLRNHSNRAGKPEDSESRRARDSSRARREERRRVVRWSDPGDRAVIQQRASSCRGPLNDGRRFGSGKLEPLHVRSSGSDLGGDEARLVSKARRARRCDGASEGRFCLSIAGNNTPACALPSPGRAPSSGRAHRSGWPSVNLEHSSILAMDSRPRRG